MIATAPVLLPPRDRRHVGIAVTIVVHAALIFGWQMTRRLPAITPDPPRSTIQWIRLPAPAVPQPRRETEEREPERTHVAPRAGAITLPRVTVPAAPAVAPPTADTPAAASTPAPPAAPSAGATMLERARRDVGAIDRALRKENNPYIVAPPDSPQIRLRKGIQAAADMAPNAWYEAPKVAELVNNTGDGARRSRVISGGGTYCVTERAPTTSIDMIEKHGKTRITSCPEHESTANAQEWRTARD
ncbi:hypothetical protein NX786_03985 [Telluria mixta]|uniref:Uncharacterized protein n=1 Tax=Telluria mixta TaxID=34071 RepID=A0ABT2BTP1_9BURK|nr:hypothetical protein [Telluria mixta]MCS0628492.1 hypothetical protein [Telluria mixta]WEM93402.1 hypothetical protein P0M04_18010 [Telluria mixta]